MVNVGGVKYATPLAIDLARYLHHMNTKNRLEHHYVGSIEGIKLHAN
jgi:hypothetical protein